MNSTCIYVREDDFSAQGKELIWLHLVDLWELRNEKKFEGECLEISIKNIYEG